MVGEMGRSEAAPMNTLRSKREAPRPLTNFTMKHIATLILLVLATASAQKSSAASQVTKKPNVVIVLIDDLGWKDLGCTGSKYYKTPHIDNLSTQGMLFTRAYSAGPVCSPSRGALFSGQYPARTKMTTVFSPRAVPSDELKQIGYDMRKEKGAKTQGPAVRWCLHPDQITFAEVLQPAGYKTGYLGKWHCGWDASQWPDKQGFEFAEGYSTIPTLTPGQWGKYFMPPAAAKLPGLTEDEYMSDALTRRAEDFITAQRQNPFLLVVSHYLVHTPLHAKPDKLAAWKDVPTTDQDNPKMAAMIESVDESVGRIVASLKKNGVWENTVLIFTSDNGGLNRGTSTYPLLGSKAMPYEGGYRVPLIVTWPGHILAGISDGTPTMNIDLYPTMLDLVGVTPNPQQHLDGVSLKPILTQGKSIADRAVYFHFPHYSGVGCVPCSAVLYKGLKLYRFYEDAREAHQLFDLDIDPYEQHDLAQIKPDEVRRLRTMLDAWLVETDAPMPIPNPKYDPNAPPFRDGKYTYERSNAIRDGYQEKLEQSK